MPDNGDTGRAINAIEARRVVERLFAAQARLDPLALAEVLHDDLEWTIMQFGMDQIRTKHDMLEMLGQLAGMVDGPWTREMTGFLFADGRAAVESRGEMPLAGGRIYRQRYHDLYEFRDGRICRVHEYLDTAAGNAAFAGTFTTDAPA